MAVDTGDGLTDADAAAILRFRRNGGGVLTARDHQDLGCCLSRLGSLGQVNEFHDPSVDQTHLCDDLDTPSISWPNYHSGANGDYQPVLPADPAARTVAIQPYDFGSDRVVPGPSARGRGDRERSVLDGGCARSQYRHGPAFQPRRGSRRRNSDDGRPIGRAIAESTFHHFADYNWNLDCGAPSFVAEPPGIADPHRSVSHGCLQRLCRQHRHLVAAVLPSGCTGVASGSGGGRSRQVRHNREPRAPLDRRQRITLPPRPSATMAPSHPLGAQQHMAKVRLVQGVPAVLGGLEQR